MEVDRVGVSGEVRDLPDFDVTVRWRLCRGIHIGPAEPVAPVVGGNVGSQQLD